MILSLGDVISHGTALSGARLDIPASEASFYANLALQEVATRQHYLGLEALAFSSVTSGENRIGLPRDFDYMKTMRLDYYSVSTTSVGGSVQSLATIKFSSQLTLADPSVVDSAMTTVSIPQVYFTYGQWIELFPSPDSSYSLTMRYVAKQPTLVQSTDTPFLDERWGPAWQYKTAEYLSYARNNMELGLIWKQQYVDYMTSTPSDRAYKQQPTIQQGLRFVQWGKK